MSGTNLHWLMRNAGSSWPVTVPRKYEEWIDNSLPVKSECEHFIACEDFETEDAEVVGTQNDPLKNENGQVVPDDDLERDLELDLVETQTVNTGANVD